MDIDNGKKEISIFRWIYLYIRQRIVLAHSLPFSFFLRFTRYAYECPTFPETYATVYRYARRKRYPFSPFLSLFPSFSLLPPGASFIFTFRFSRFSVPRLQATSLGRLRVSASISSAASASTDIVIHARESFGYCCPNEIETEILHVFSSFERSKKEKGKGQKKKRRKRSCI